jgi:hypothetical protein
MAVVFAALFCAGLQPLLQLPKFWHLHHYASPFSLSVEYVPFPHMTKMLMLRRGLVTLFPHLQDLGWFGIWPLVVFNSRGNLEALGFT